MPMMVGGGGGLGLIIFILAMVNPLGGGSGVDVSNPPGYEAQAPAGQTTTLQECRTGADANRRDDCRIVGFVNSIQDYWNGEFQRAGQQYQPAQLVLFSGATQSGCGTGQAAQGPFYCPLDKKVYMDLTFFQEMQQRFGAQGGPFAQGYVVAHEYGHHVQNLIGALDDDHGSRTRGPQGSAVRVELMADCLAGAWARNAADTGYLQQPTEQEVGEALNAAAAVGDDRIQRATQGRVSPESWTHGSSQQRQQWFMNGYKGGNITACNTTQGRV
jgi:predicted metalloprotease